MRTILIVLALAVVAVTAQSGRLRGTPRVKFAISVDKKPFFNVVAANGEKFLTSETYNSWDAAFNGAASVIGTGGDRRFYQDRGTHFVLKGANGEVIGKSENLGNVKRGVEQCINEIARLTEIISEHVIREPAPKSTYRIEVVKGGAEPHYRLVAANNKIVGFSENYGRGGLETGIAAALKECRTNDNFQNSGDTPHFVCTSPGNHKKLFQGQTYKRNANRDKGIRAAQSCINEEILRYLMKDDPIAEAKAAYMERVQQQQQTANDFTSGFEEQGQQQQRR